VNIYITLVNRSNIYCHSVD